MNMPETPDPNAEALKSWAEVEKRVDEKNAAHNAAHKAERDAKLPAIKESEHKRGKEPFNLETFLEYEPDPTGRGEKAPLTHDEIAELEWMYYAEAPKNRLTIERWINYRLANNLGFL